MRTIRSFYVERFIVSKENLVFAVVFCSFSIIGMGFDCFTKIFVDLDGWGAVAEVETWKCGNIY
jgi:hypothetical protein